jgi:KaiC/GvpD/RAD55 family RecA-like ATPase
VKVYAKLEQFLTNLAYCAFSEPGLLEICEAAGIEWAWPKTFAGDVVQEFTTLRNEVGEAKARAKVQGSVRLLESQIQNLSSLPTDLESMRVEYRELARVQKAIDTANLILQEPTNYERIISSFETFESDAVATCDFSQLKSVYGLVKASIAEKGPKVRIPGYFQTSELIGGFNPARMTLLLAQSGFGKSNLGMNLAIAAADVMAVGYMNLEMSFDDIASRLAVIKSRKSWSEHYENQISIDDIGDEPKFELRFSDGSELHVDSVIAWARAFKRTNPSFGLLIIDYDQKLAVDTNRDTPEWKALHLAVRELENLAKQIGIHIIVVAQFNRQGEIASSWRVINTAHSVIKFREYDGGVVIENSIKARHAKYPCAVWVDYDRSRALVTERTDTGVFDFKEEDQKKFASQEKTKNEASFSSRMKGNRTWTTEI